MWEERKSFSVKAHDGYVNTALKNTVDPVTTTSLYATPRLYRPVFCGSN
jgi:hypothetical protein